MENEERKSKLVAGLLGIFLGSYGVHNFYLGYTQKGLIQVIASLGSIALSVVLWIISGLLSVVFIGFLIMPIAFILDFVPTGIWVWGLIEGIMILSGNINKDAKGNPLKD